MVCKSGYESSLANPRYYTPLCVCCCAAVLLSCCCGTSVGKALLGWSVPCLVLLGSSFQHFRVLQRQGSGEWHCCKYNTQILEGMVQLFPFPGIYFHQPRPYGVHARHRNPFQQGTLHLLCLAKKIEGLVPRRQSLIWPDLSRATGARTQSSVGRVPGTPSASRMGAMTRCLQPGRRRRAPRAAEVGGRSLSAQCILVGKTRERGGRTSASPSQNIVSTMMT